MSKLETIEAEIRSLPREKAEELQDWLSEYLEDGAELNPAFVESIERGKVAIVQATPEGILLKPVTAAMIERGFGLLKRKPGDKSFAEEWAEHKREEMELEEAKYARCTGSQ